MPPSGVAALRAFDERDISMAKAREVTDGFANTKALSIDTRVLHMGQRSVQIVTAGIPGDSLGVELISSRPSTPRSQRVSICCLRKFGGPEVDCD